MANPKFCKVCAIYIGEYKPGESGYTPGVDNTCISCKTNPVEGYLDNPFLRIEQVPKELRKQVALKKIEVHQEKIKELLEEIGKIE